MISNSNRVLILAPTENDSSVAASVLSAAGISTGCCRDIRDLCTEIQKGCGMIVVAEEALSSEGIRLLHNQLVSQEPWSDLPVILIAEQGVGRSWEAFSASGNISILERPFSRVTMVRAVQVGLRARQKQYQTRHLIEQQVQAAQKRDDFFATLSHELRTPLNVILGWVDILKQGGLDEAGQAEALTVLERNAKQQTAFIEDLLDTSRIITGKLHFEYEVVCLNQLLESAKQSFGPRAVAKKIKVELILPKHNCNVRADEQRLSQVVANLMTNAIKFTGENGQIVIELSHSKTECAISFKDNGQGIDPAFLPHVFDRLKQEDMSTTRIHGGLGLGLAITSHIVEQHHGTIEARSEGRGKGAEFILRLPAEGAVIPQHKPTPRIETTPVKTLAGVRVLVADDSPDILQLIELWLKRAKADVRLASSASAALSEFDNFKPDVMLSDIGMPEMDGYELISKVRAHSDRAVREVPAVALTAYAKDEEKTRALAAGFQLHISKPISKDQLVSAVAALAASQPVTQAGS